MTRRTLCTKLLATTQEANTVEPEIKDYPVDEWADDAMTPSQFAAVCVMIVAANAVWVGVGVFIGWAVWG